MDLERFVLLLLRKAAINMIAESKWPDQEELRASMESDVRLYWGEKSTLFLEADEKEVRVHVCTSEKNEHYKFSQRYIFCLDKWIGAEHAGKEA